MHEERMAVNGLQLQTTYGTIQIYIPRNIYTLTRNREACESVCVYAYLSYDVRKVQKRQIIIRPIET